MLVYISHPYTGNEQKNIMDAERIAKTLAWKYQNHIFINPLATMRHEGLAGLDYDITISHCLKLLEKCDAVIMAGDWEESRGCMTEYEFARKVPKRIYRSVKEFVAVASLDKEPATP